jgi:predicted SAM-dependent methyltransferase/uncharacterized coiled-coil protein SlyX
MKQTIRSIARKLSTLPLIGGAVHIAAAIRRLPQFRVQLAQIDSVYRAQLDVYRAQIERLECTYREQLPAILDALSKVNARQHMIDQDQQNLLVSVPVALRMLRQDIGRLDGVVGALQGDASSTRQRIDGIDLAATSQRDAFAALEADISQKQVQFSGLNDYVQYLNNRIEFVRRELMFEMRYGHGTAENGNESLEAEARVVDADKLAKAKESTLRLNLGCGHVPIEGFINVDRRELPGVDVVAEANALPSELGQADEIFSSHMLEHFPQEQLRRELLPHWKSMLKKGGVLRAVVPDAEAMIREYGNGNYPYDDLREVLYGGQDYDGDFHFNMFTPEHLGRLMEEAGFESINVIEAGRLNGRCYEFEISAKRP